MWLIKVKKASNSSFLPLMLLIFMLMNFNPLIKVLLFVPQGEDLSFFSFVRGTNLFSVSKFTCSPKKESEKLKNSHFGQIHVQFVLLTVSCWVSVMNEHSLWIHISQLLCDPLGQHHCKDHSQLYSLCNTKLRHQIQFLRVRRHQGLSMKRGSVFRIPHIQWVYPMPYSTFCISHLECIQFANHIDHLGGFLRKNRAVNLVSAHTDTWLSKTEKKNNNNEYIW